MARSPKRPKPKLVVSNDGEEFSRETEATQEEPAELTPKQELWRAALEASQSAGFADDPFELHQIIAEQWLSPHERATARWKRKANESLCQAIESSEAFKAAWENLKS